MSEDLLVQFRLIKDKELTAAQMTDLKTKSGYDWGLQLALNYISYQLRTQKEIDDYLKTKEFSKVDRQKIIQRLLELRVLDDLFYAESYVRTQLALADKGPKQLHQKLKQKGVAESTIQYALTLYDEGVELTLAQQTALKLNKRIHHKSHRERLQKIRLGLVQKGYQSAIIEQVMQEVVIEPDAEDEHLALMKVGQRVWQRNQRLSLVKRQQKVKQALYAKGFTLDAIQEFIDRECIDGTDEID